MKKPAICFLILTAAILPAISYAGLANDSLQGLRVSSIDRALRLSDEEVDLATAALLLSREWGANKNLYVYRRMIDTMSEAILKQMEQKKIKPDYRAIEIINKYLFEEQGFKTIETADDPDDLFLHVVLERKRGYCLSLSVLYLSIAERIGLPAYGVVVPGHFFVRYDDGDRQYNIETTSAGVIASDKHYLEKFSPPDGTNSVYMKNLTKKQVLGCFFNNLGNCYLQRGQIDYAYEYLSRAAQINPSLAEAHTNLGNVLLRLNRPGEAVAQYEHALTLIGPDAINYNNLGNAYLQLGEYPKARDLYIKALNLKNDFIDAYRNLAQAYQSLGDQNKAIAQMQAAVILKPRDCQNWIYLGQLYRQCGQLDAAKNAYSRSIEISPELAASYSGMGYIYLDKKDYSSALDMFNRAISIQPDAGIWFGMAMSFHYLGRIDEEIHAYQQVLTLDSTQVGALQNLGNAYLQQQKPQMAAQCYSQAIELNPQNADLHYNLAAAYANLKQYNKAIDSYKSSLSINSESGAAWNGLAICYYLNGDSKTARTCALKAQKMGVQVQKELLEEK